MPLIELCKTGHLFEVQEWIAAGKPVNLPYNDPKCQRLLSPLEIAIDKGFHSLVAVLLEGGAIQEPMGWDMPIYRAIRQKRRDLIELLVDHGQDTAEVDMHQVFETWEPGLMEYFIEKGADPEADNALASALCQRIRTALGRYKKYKDRFPGFQEQANIALRYHSSEGNLKWVSLMLWAGADPYAPGRRSLTEPVEDNYPEYSAVRNAADYGQLEAFKLLTRKNFDPDDPENFEMMKYASTDKDVELIELLISKGVDFSKHGKEMSEIMHSLITSIDWHGGPWGALQERGSIDNKRARNSMKIILILAGCGVCWTPSNDDIKRVRRSLLKMAPCYAMDFVRIMSENNACNKDVLVELLRTPSIQRHASMYECRISSLLAAMG
jgi:ankyrin repeat protein